MFPPESPKSPLDGPQIPVGEEIPKMLSPSEIIRKSSDTIRNNIDIHDEITKKRTSIQIEDEKNCNLTEIDLTADQLIISDEQDLDNNNKRHRISMTSSSNDDDYGDDYNELEENGNTSSDHRDSIVSSEDLNIDALNTLNKRISIVDHTELLSPNEVPMGRRYAEINSGNNTKWSDTSHHNLRSRHTPIGTIDDHDGVGTLIDDDLQALLPASHELSRDDLSQSRASLVSSSDGGVLAEGETSSDASSCDGGSATSPPCDLGLVERLLRTHPVWFLPGIQRAGAVHLLQGKEEGNFIVRGSSQPNTMAVSVRLPPNTGPYIEHYLIQSNSGLLSLESSRFKFDSIPSLIAHYAQCCDELPVQLILPRALRDAKNRQQLSSLALLGQEFWRYPMATPKTKNSQMINSSQMMMMGGGGSNQEAASVIIQNQEKIFGSAFNGTNNNNFSNSNNQIVVSQAETPSDTTSSLSSFTSTTPGQQLLSPESIDSVILTMSPIESCRTGIIGKTSTFKSQNKKMVQTTTTTNSLQSSGAATTTTATNQIISQCEVLSNKITLPNTMLDVGISDTVGIRAPRPTPPNTLNLGPLRTPPAPPPRWSKPPTPISSPSTETVSGIQTSSNNFTVTTTVTFSVEGGNANSPQIVEVTSPNGNNTFQTISKRLSPEGECKQNMDTMSSQNSSKRWQQNNPSKSKIVSPDTPSSCISNSGSSSRIRRTKARKESKHYQESDILESPSVYCRSALGDKFSDYEDIWSQDNINSSTLTRGGHNMSSFRPEGTTGKRPDLLPEGTITSLNGNLLSPPGSSSPSSTQHSPPNVSKQTTPQVLSPQQEPIPDFIRYPNAIQHSQSQSNVTHTQNIRYIDEDNENNNNMEEKNLKSFQSNPILQPRNRFGLILPNSSGIDMQTDENSLMGTPTSNPPLRQSKQGSPFYAEPADALSNVVHRRGQPLRQIPQNQRFSEPPKGPIRLGHLGNVGLGQSGIQGGNENSEKLRNAGSLDELKKKHRKARGRLDPWPLDSSWEFMGNDDDNDYDTDANWSKPNQVNVVKRENNKDVKKNERPLTIHQIMVFKLPELNLPELVRFSSSPPTSIAEEKIQVNANQNNNNTVVSGNESGFETLTRRQRVSAYDNVEKNSRLESGNGYAQTSILNFIDAHSDDGTVFSEPWDSSQWDSFLPQHDVTESSDTIHLSKCHPAVCLSEDDTIVEETTNNSSQMTITNKPPLNQPQKIATILRNNRLHRDRDILCHPRNKSISGGPGDSIGAYTLTLASDHSSTFARNIENFISCTKDSRETSPQVVMRNMRQFMSGMKNYLVKHGEGDFQREVQRARSRLKSDEFLNLDTILESVMHRLVVLPLREHLYGLLVDYYKRSGDIQQIVDNIKYACQRSAAVFGIRETVTPPTDSALREIACILVKLQEAELPIDKLGLLLSAVSAIFESTGAPRGQQLGADDFLPLLVLVVAKTGFYSAEIEVEFMWGLLQPSLLSGEAGYYITALCSAVHALKRFMSSDNEGTGSLDWRSSSLPASSSVLRVIIPDEYNGSLQTRTLPVRPHTTTKDVCRTIAHKAKITNPQDYGLFKLVDGEETLLLDNECPQDVRIAARGKHCILAYKRIDAKIAWPTITASSF